ncbi:hypothetical protein F5J12DRAFT_921984 [Pisolithus orientalis]|uniref:uncharacterized protein n=1 Tax=Pisolithus orientalis TaxID=936130 RepID=UPI0022241725|nr:uncharacterized protein F5J12DRAFT_921984 [Pisolithus orientalis]KAI6001104.1 hypothetical protein F5J12DRAFT_921984 [Pisolithus orientalis]
MSLGQLPSEPQVLSIKAGQVPKYAFLAHPPPPKKRPAQPLPSPPSQHKYQAAAAPPVSGFRRPSSTFAAITAWATHVQPGSPASLSPRSPRSPRRRSSLGRGRRPSITSVRVTSGSFLNIAPTPTTTYGTTPSIADFKPDLTAVGYTSVFLQLPNTPLSAAPRGLTRFRSLSVLRPRTRSKSAAPSSPTKMKAKVAATSAAIMKRKKAKYAAMRPPPLANELALMQFADGGSTNDNVRRLMEAQAKAAGGIGVSDVYRDGEGGIWWDREEEWEYAHLLAGGSEMGAHGTGELQWVTFGGESSPSALGIDGEERRGSVSTQDSDLDPHYIVQPTDHLDVDDLATFGSAMPPLDLRKPAMSVLALPSRPRRTAKHLRKPDYLVDVAFSRVSLSPRSPKFGSSAFTGKIKSDRKARKRPAPLKLMPSSPPLKKPSNSPGELDRGRREFLSSSFEPPIPATPVTAANVADAQARGIRGKLTTRVLNIPHASQSMLSLPLNKVVGKKPSMLAMMGFFKPSRKEDAQCLMH